MSAEWWCNIRPASELGMKRRFVPHNYPMTKCGAIRGGGGGAHATSGECPWRCADMRVSTLKHVDTITPDGEH